MRTERRAFAFGALCLLASLAGCGARGPQSERSGAAAKELLPAELAAVLPDTVVLCHTEGGPDSSGYRLWVLRDPSTALLVLPRDLEGIESREFAADAVQSWFRAKAPWVAEDVPGSGQGRFTRWRRGDREYQLREAVAERGWYATLEVMDAS